MVNATGPDTIRLLPPLNVAEDEIDEALAAESRTCLRALAASRPPRLSLSS